RATTRAEGIEPISAEGVDPAAGVEGISGDIDMSDELLPITDDMLTVNDEIAEVAEEDEEDDESDNMWLWIGAGAAVVVLLGIVVYMIKKQ
ncbi:MAG: hypothetical protein FWC68_02590, partial [Oscillospiraceae bacterium]|nr:hypothetical protein [Oscillospiraceae bacterium]